MFKAVLRRSALLALASASVGPIASASDPPPEAYSHKAALSADIKPGMQMSAVNELLGRAADVTEHVGIGCGFIDVSRWRDLPVKVISVDGRVDSVVPTGAAQLHTQ